MNPFNLNPVGDVLFEALTVQELKSHARINHSADDAYLAVLCVAARQQVEKDLNLAIVGQNYDLHLENGFYHFYNYLYGGVYDQTGPFYTFNNVYHYPKLHIPIQPLSPSYPVSITYQDVTNVTQTFDAANYTVKYWKDPPEIMLQFTPLPGIFPGSDIIVNFTAGYVSTGAVSTVPQLIKQAIQLLASGWYENREPVSDALIRPVPVGYERILKLLQIKRFK